MTLPSSFRLSQTASSPCSGEQLSFGAFSSTRLFGRTVNKQQMSSNAEEINGIVVLGTIGQGRRTGLDHSPVEFSFRLSQTVSYSDVLQKDGVSMLHCLNKQNQL